MTPTSDPALSPVLPQPGTGLEPELGGHHKVGELVQAFREAVIAFYSARTNPDGGKSQSAKLHRAVISLDAKLRDAGRPATVALAPLLKDPHPGVALYAAFYFEQISDELALMASNALTSVGGPIASAAMSVESRLCPDLKYAGKLARRKEGLRRWAQLGLGEITEAADKLPEPISGNPLSRRALDAVDTLTLVRRLRDVIIRYRQSNEDQDQSLTRTRQLGDVWHLIEDELRRRGPLAHQEVAKLLTDTNYGVRAYVACFFEDLAPELAVKTFVELAAREDMIGFSTGHALDRVDPHRTIRRALC